MSSHHSSRSFSPSCPFSSHHVRKLSVAVARFISPIAPPGTLHSGQPVGWMRVPVVRLRFYPRFAIRYGKGRTSTAPCSSTHTKPAQPSVACPCRSLVPCSPFSSHHSTSGLPLLLPRFFFGMTPRRARGSGGASGESERERELRLPSERPTGQSCDSLGRLRLAALLTVSSLPRLPPPPSPRATRASWTSRRHPPPRAVTRPVPRLRRRRETRMRGR